MFNCKTHTAKTIICSASSLLLAVMSPGITKANYWCGKRSPDGKAMHGYYIDPSLEAHAYQQAVRDGISKWLFYSPTVTSGLFEWSSIPIGVNNIDVYKAERSSPKIDRAYGVSISFVRAPHGTIVPTTENNMIDWYVCKVSFFYDKIDAASGGDIDLQMRLVQAVATHETGHSLKLAHSDRSEDACQKTDRIGHSIMQNVIFDAASIPTRILVSDVEPYDINELQKKWGTQ